MSLSDGGSVFAKNGQKPPVSINITFMARDNIILSYSHYKYCCKNFEPLWSPQLEFETISYLLETQADTIV